MRASMRRAVGDDRRGGDRRAGPAEAEQEQPREDLPRGPLGDEAAQGERDQQDHSPGDQDGAAAEAVGRPADERREGEHAEHVDRDHEPDDLEVRAAVLHVQRRHDHHRHHRRVGAGHRHHRGADRRHVAHDRGEARPTTGRAARDPRWARPRRASWASEQRVGPQAHTQTQPAASDEHDRADREPAGELGDARGTGRTAPPTPVRLGPATAPMVVAHTTTDSARARCSSVRQVGRGVARPAVDRRGRPSSTAPSEQHEHRVDDAGDDGEHRAGGPDEVARDQADTAPAAAHDAARARRPQRRCRGPGRSARGRPCVSLPEMSRASSEAVATPIVTPTAPTAWETTGCGPCGAGRPRRRGRAPRPVVIARCPGARVAQHGGPHLLGRHARVERLLGGAAVELAHDGELGPGAGVGPPEGVVEPCPELRVPHRHPSRTATARARTPPGRPRRRERTTTSPQPACRTTASSVLGPPVGEVARAADRPVGGPALAVALLERHPAAAPPGRVTAARRRQDGGQVVARGRAGATRWPTRRRTGPPGEVRSSTSGSSRSQAWPCSRSSATKAGVTSVRRTARPSSSISSASRPPPEPISSTRAPGPSRSARSSTSARTESGTVAVRCDVRRRVAVVGADGLVVSRRRHVVEVVDDVVQVVAAEGLDGELVAVGPQPAATARRIGDGGVEHRHACGRPRPARRRPTRGPGCRSRARPRWRPGPSWRRWGRPRSSISRTRSAKSTCTSRTWQAYSSGDQTPGSRAVGRVSAARAPATRGRRGVEKVAAGPPRRARRRRSRTRGTGASRTQVQSFVSGRSSMRSWPSSNQSRRR